MTQLLSHVTSSPHDADLKGDIFRHTIFPPSHSFYILGVTVGRRRPKKSSVWKGYDAHVNSACIQRPRSPPPPPLLLTGRKRDSLKNTDVTHYYLRHVNQIWKVVPVLNLVLVLRSEDPSCSLTLALMFARFWWHDVFYKQEVPV